MDKIRVVLIEDHTLTRLGLKTALDEQPDIECVGDAASGNEGLVLLHKQKPDVAIVDVGLPDIDGIEVTQRFKEAQKQLETADTKILILTSHDSEDAVLAAFAAGADSYCMKDIDLTNLITAIRDTQEGNAWIDPTIASVVLRQVRDTVNSSKAESAERTIEIDAVAPELESLLQNTPLTGREMEILELIVSGNSNSAIAEKLYITLGTVKTHVRNILNKLGVDDRTQAAVRALRSGLIH
ncbi:response regulator [Lyngbya confervoides]|uniref:Response regulator transcription factor n=1 Tax=Lyngbya confervoides BDU141951 TaxID=1574623 RepID=A0ABD4SZH3_9CYAN|nr:response regulator transcription factor [Lyngbya confervoides]MCM1981689.1 response regulator transcription factor [Lyngbya confervoides BDU141951]